MRMLKMTVVLMAAALVAGALAAPATVQAADPPEWVVLTPAETLEVQQRLLADASEQCPRCQVTGQWDANWQQWLNEKSQGWGYVTVKDGKFNTKALSQFGYVPNTAGNYIILTDANPDWPAEWLTLSPAEIRAVQQSKLAGNEAECPKCQVTGQWDADWEQWLNEWTRGWNYRTLSGGRLNANVLGQIGFVGSGDGKWMILDQPNPGEGGGWVTLTSADTMKLQQALLAARPAFFAAPCKASGQWDQAWSDALLKWGQSDEWKPPQVQNWQGVLLLNERRPAPAVLDRMGFAIDDAKALVAVRAP